MTAALMPLQQAHMHAHPAEVTPAMMQMRWCVHTHTDPTETLSPLRDMGHITQQVKAQFCHKTETRGCPAC